MQFKYQVSVNKLDGSDLIIAREARKGQFPFYTSHPLNYILKSFYIVHIN